MDSWILRVSCEDAEPSRWEALCRGLRSSVEGRPEDTVNIIIVGLLLLVLVAAIVVLPYLLLAQDRLSFRGPRRLFLSLGRAHGLTWRERWWLWRLARTQQLHQPALLFVEPERFSTSLLSPALRKHAAALEQLKERLFRETSTPLTLSTAGKPEDRPRSATPLPPVAMPPTFELPSLPADAATSR